MQAQDHFVAERKPRWQELDMMLGNASGLHELAPAGISRAGSLYRSLCADLMRARSAGYEHDLVTYLDGLAARAHNQLYGARPLRLGGLVRLVTHEFPRTLRAQGRFFAIASALFVVPMVVALIAVIIHPPFATDILPRSMLEASAQSYADGLEGRASGTDASMAGFYVNNNVGIAFRCFATGIMFGLGSIFFLVYNGIVIGTIVGWVIVRGHGDNILTFICGHAPFELTAICIAGAAGLQMGYALVRTNGLTRLGSLRAQAPALGSIISGAALMLMIAALIEGFWSPSGVAAPVKWVVAGVLTLLVAGYLAFAGRRRTRR
ncbi:MAG: stage II sporulation protein M [Deltaproteobacteria bacterium]|nr:stage II sporulation protein M [Deltaproteobacteria bacterium]